MEHEISQTSENKTFVPTCLLKQMLPGQYELIIKWNMKYHKHLKTRHLFQYMEHCRLPENKTSAPLYIIAILGLKYKLFFFT
jgi:hypothetical protein